MSKSNGSDWHTLHHADVHFTDEEVWALSQMEVGADPSELYMSLSIAEHEMRCQRNMIVRGRRLWNYHIRVGDLLDILGIELVTVRNDPAIITHRLSA